MGKVWAQEPRNVEIFDEIAILRRFSSPEGNIEIGLLLIIVLSQWREAIQATQLNRTGSSYLGP